MVPCEFYFLFKKTKQKKPQKPNQNQWLVCKLWFAQKPPDPFPTAQVGFFCCVSSPLLCRFCPASWLCLFCPVASPAKPWSLQHGGGHAPLSRWLPAARMLSARPAGCARGPAPPWPTDAPSVSGGVGLEAGSARNRTEPCSEPAQRRTGYLGDKGGEVQNANFCLSIHTPELVCK